MASTYWGSDFLGNQTRKGKTMNVADYISKRTSKFDPRIQRYENGDILFRWARPLHPSKVADAIGIEQDMIDADWRDLLLHVPAGIATQKCKS